ncbi:GNAT family N-acetyltransferase [Kineococcus auxinigenes]|uniref:GNAT family N-acetyltransferase n=1 Tax=unclassified Kineococcus TaxID=2621656 RepID=UPI003D7D48F6
MTDPELTSRLDDVDWDALDAALRADGFHNGRTPEEMRRSCENSHRTVLAVLGGEVVSMGRVLSDGVGNAYLVDVWTASAHRRRGLAGRVVRELLDSVPGQHVGLWTDDAGEFYETLGFTPQAGGMSLVVGRWLGRFTPPAP